MTLYCSGCDQPLPDAFVKEGEKIFCGKIMDQATVVKKDE